jgi:hypothetical protein
VVGKKLWLGYAGYRIIGINGDLRDAEFRRPMKTIENRNGRKEIKLEAWMNGWLGG